jgi:hypothetical protein
MKILSYFGTATSILGAFLMAFGFVLAGYVFFSLGSVSWLIVGVTRKDKPLIILNATFFVANIIGLVRSFI